MPVSGAASKCALAASPTDSASCARADCTLPAAVCSLSFACESAVRAWATADAQARKAVEAVDAERIRYLQKLLVDAERDQVLAVHGMQHAARARRRHPAAAEHFQRAARLQRALRELFFELGGRDVPVRRQSVEAEIFKPHGRGTRGKSREVYRPESGEGRENPATRASQYSRADAAPRPTAVRRRRPRARPTRAPTDAAAATTPTPRRP